MNTAIITPNAPAAVGPYAQGRTYKEMIFTSGQLPIIPGSGELIKGDIEKATQQSLDNLLAIVEAAGGQKETIVKVTIFVVDMKQYPQINKIYADFFGEHKPARSLVQVSALPLGGEIEIEAIAFFENPTNLD